MVDSFTRDKFAWLDQVLADPKVTPQAFAVAYVIATRFLNRKTGTAWPAVATLGAHINKSARRAQDAITNLIDQRHLNHRRGGTGKDRKGIPSTYWIVIFDKTAMSGQSNDRQDDIVRSVEELNGQERPIKEGLTGQFQPTDRTELSRLTGRKRPTNPLNEPNEEPVEEYISSNAADLFNGSQHKDGPASIAEIAVREWNAMADDCGIRQVQHLTDKRRRKLPLRLSEIGEIEGWRIMLNKISASPFLLGRNKDGWKVTFDWVLEPGNLTKIMEGNYDGQRRESPNQHRSLADIAWRDDE